MNVEQQNQHARGFFASCLSLLNTKGPDYAPDNVALLEVLETAWESDSTPEKVLWSYMKKQISAVRRYVRFGTLASETPQSRFRDIANYAALFSFWEANRDVIVLAAMATVRKYRSCGEKGCESLYPNEAAWCEDCQFLLWLRNFHTKIIDGYASRELGSSQ